MVKNLNNKTIKFVYITVSVILCIIAIAFMPKIINAAATYFAEKTHSATKTGSSKLEVVKKEEVDK